jgi:hypothetical protein
MQRVSIFSLITMLVWAGGCERRIQEGPARTKAEVVQLISSIEPWRADGRYSGKAWSRAIKVAQILQHSDPEIIGEGLDDFINCSLTVGGHGDYEDNSKPFLLLRVMFELPQTNSVAPEVAGFRVWRYSGTNVPSASWPISWTNGKPFLSDPWQGSYGRPYAARAEYDYLRKKYALRHFGLDSVK